MNSVSQVDVMMLLYVVTVAGCSVVGYCRDPDRKIRFSLRTLLSTMTVVAIALGLIVWASRWLRIICEL